MAIDVAGVYALAADLGKGGRAAAPLARLVVQKSAADIKATAAAIAPYDTGNLSSSIGYTTRSLAGGAAAEIGPTVDYGFFQEFGTSTHGPQPFMGPALDAHTGPFEAAIAAIARPLG